LKRRFLKELRRELNFLAAAAWGWVGGPDLLAGQFNHVLLPSFGESRPVKYQYLPANGTIPTRPYRFRTNSARSTSPLIPS
jgi:hypothetical protein